MGFKTEQFVGNVDENFKCSICLEVLKDPWQCGDGHTFCKDCITLCLRDRQICPMGNNPLQLKNLARNLVVKNVVENLEVYCHPPKSNGQDAEESEPKCDWTGKLQSLAKHRETCPFQQVQCPNVGCNTNIQRRELEDHDEICEYKEVECDEKCGEILRKRDLPDHKRNDCPEVRLLCPNDCRTSHPTVVKRKNINTHRGTCPFQRVLCPNMGCNTNIQRKELEDHDKICDYKDVKCQKCKEVLVRLELPVHENEDCLEEMLPCQNRSPETGQISKIKRDDCVDCPYKDQGCSVQVERKHVDKHIQNNMAAHMTLLDKENKQLKKELNQVKEELNQVKVDYQTVPVASQQMQYRGPGAQVSGPFNQVQYPGYSPSASIPPPMYPGQPVMFVRKVPIPQHLPGPQFQRTRPEQQPAPAQVVTPSQTAKSTSPKVMHPEVKIISINKSTRPAERKEELKSDAGKPQVKTDGEHAAELKRFSEAFPWSLPPPVYPGQPLMYVRNAPIPQNKHASPQFQQTRPEQQPAPAPRKKNIIQIKDPDQDNKDVTDEILSQSFTNATNSGSPSLSGH